MKKISLAAIISLSMMSSGCAVVAVGAGAGGYKLITDRRASAQKQEESRNSVVYLANKVTRVYTCSSEGSLCNEVYVDKRTDGLVKSPLWYEDGWMYSNTAKPDGKVDRVCEMKGDAIDSSSCNLIENMKVKEAKTTQVFFEQLKDAYSKQK